MPAPRSAEASWARTTAKRTAGKKASNLIGMSFNLLCDAMNVLAQVLWRALRTMIFIQGSDYVFSSTAIHALSKQGVFTGICCDRAAASISGVSMWRLRRLERIRYWGRQVDEPRRPGDRYGALRLKGFSPWKPGAPFGHGCRGGQ